MEKTQNVLCKENELDEDTLNFLKGFSSLMTEMASLPIPDQRSKIKEMFLPPKDQLEPIERVEDRMIKGRHGDIPLRILTPKNPNNTTLVFFHRGGWVFGNNDESEGLGRKIANITSCNVVLVEYRLSPEYKFPIPLDDCYDATLWVENNKSSLMGSPQKVVVIGESAGGNLATAVSLKAQKEKLNLSGQILVYPILTHELNPEVYENSPDKYLLSYENMQWFWEQYLTSSNDGQDELASPLNVNGVKLPKTLMMTAEFDALKVEGKEYAEKLEKAGTLVTKKEYSKVIHGFLDLPLPSSEIQRALSDIKEFVLSIN